MNDILKTITELEIKPLLSPKYTTPWSFTEEFATSLDHSLQDFKERLRQRAEDFAINRGGCKTMDEFRRRKIEMMPEDVVLAYKSLLQDSK